MSNGQKDEERGGWQCVGSFVREYESASQSACKSEIKRLRRLKPDNSYYIMEVVNPKSDQSDRFNVCRDLRKLAL